MNARQTDVATAVRTPLLITLSGVGVVAVLAYGFPAGAPSREVLVATALVLAPLAALCAAVAAALAAPRQWHGPWQLFSTAAAFAVLGQVHRHAGVGAELETLHLLSNVAATLLFAAAVGWILHLRTSGRALEIGLDAGMVLTACFVAAVRWTGLEWPAVGGSAAGAAEGLALLAGTVAAGAAAVAGVVLIIARTESGPVGNAPAGAATLPLAAAALALGFAVLPLRPEAAGSGAQSLCCMSGGAALAFVVGWLGAGYAALRSVRRQHADGEPAATLAAESRVRLLVAPLCALMLGTLAVDAASGSLDAMTSAAAGALGILVALRLGHLLYVTRSRSAEQLELAHSVALIEVSQALSGMRQLDETLALVSRWAVRLLDGKAAVIELLMPDGETLELRAVHGLPAEMQGLRFPVEGSFTGWVVRHGRPRATPDATLDPLLHATSVPYLTGLPLASVPLRYSSTALGALSCVGRRPFTQSDLDLLGAFADQAAVAIENARLFRQVHQLSITDPLTGLINRRQLERDLAREFAAAQRGRRLVAVMFDLNRFKLYNDRYGHLAGDDALRLFARSLSSIMRTMNVAARYGGDEFIVLLADTDATGAEVFVQKVQSAFPGAEPDGHLGELSVCAGFAEYDSTMLKPDDLIAAADAALYLNKIPHARL